MCSSIFGNRLVIDDPYYQPTVVVFDLGLSKLFHHVMRYCTLCQMFDEDAHFGVIAETAFLLIKSEMCRM